MGDAPSRGRTGAPSRVAGRLVERGLEPRPALGAGAIRRIEGATVDADDVSERLDQVGGIVQRRNVRLTGDASGHIEPAEARAARTAIGGDVERSLVVGSADVLAAVLEAGLGAAGSGLRGRSHAFAAAAREAPGPSLVARWERWDRSVVSIRDMRRWRAIGRAASDGDEREERRATLRRKRGAPS